MNLMRIARNTLIFLVALSGPIAAQTINITVNVVQPPPAQLWACYDIWGHAHYGYDPVALKASVDRIGVDAYRSSWPLPGVDYVNTVSRFGRPSRRIWIR